MRQNAPSSNRRCSAAQGQMETRSQSTPICQHHPTSMSHQNSTLVQLCGTCLCLPQNKAKENGHSQKILRRLLITSWQRKDVWKTLFQNKSGGTINPVHLPRKLLNNTKNVSINKTLSITNLAQYFYPATLEEHPINNYDPDRVLFWKT